MAHATARAHQCTSAGTPLLQTCAKAGVYDSATKKTADASTLRRNALAWPQDSRHPKAIATKLNAHAHTNASAQTSQLLVNAACRCCMSRTLPACGHSGRHIVQGTKACKPAIMHVRKAACDTHMASSHRLHRHSRQQARSLKQDKKRDRSSM